MSRTPLMNIEVDNLTIEEAVQKIDELICSDSYCYVVTPNSDHIVMLEKNEAFYAAYQKADLILADGTPLLWIAKLYGRPLKARVAGSDMFPEVCKLAAQKGYSVFLLGAAEGVAQQAAKNLCQSNPGLQIAGCYSPPFGFEKHPHEIKRIIQIVHAAKPDILILGVGSPKQEIFMHQYASSLMVPITLGFGAGIDFAAGNVRRAPKWMCDHGLEWLFRLIKEPRRLFKRYLGDTKIFGLAWKYRKLKKST